MSAYWKVTDSVIRNILILMRRVKSMRNILCALFASRSSHNNELRYNGRMKKSRKLSKSFDYSPIALRALTRHSYAPPVKKFKDKKHDAKKYGCRSKQNEL